MTEAGRPRGRRPANAALPAFGDPAGPSPEALLSAAIAATPTGVVISDPARPDCPIVFVNPAFTAITGYPPEEVLGRNCRFLQGRDTDPRAVEKVRRAIAAEQAVTVEMVNYRRDGTRFWNELRISPVRGEDGRLTHLVGIQHDVTARHRAQEGQKRARRAAERASRTKSDFLATMSHEIRTPMNGVMGTLSLLLDTELTPEQRAYAETAQRCGRDLLAIINEILDLSRIEAGMVALEERPFPLAALLRDVLGLAGPAAAAKGIDLGAEIDPALPPVLRGDAQRLRQVLTNLVDNAVKFTAVGGVTLRAARDGTDDGPGGAGRLTLRLSVTDTGIGIPREVQARLFRRWTQADATISRRFGGSGLGLTICRRLVRLMGGEITLESEAGRGSTFTVTLPLAAAEPGAETEAADPDAPLPAVAGRAGARWRILLAEDSRANQIVAAAILRRAGYAVEIAEDGEQAVSRAAEGGFDLVLMDVRMPRRTGLEATAGIRRLPGAAGQVPIIAMTAGALPEDRAACLQAGMDGHVAKPVDAATLLAAVSDALAGRAPVRAAASPRPPDRLIDDAMLAELRRAVGEGRIASLLAVFSEETEARLAALAEAVAREDLATAAHLAHGMRSAAGSFGATALAGAAGALEEAATAGDMAATRRAHGPIAALAAESLAALGAAAAPPGEDARLRSAPALP